MSEQRDNSGVLFKNDRKSTTKHPDYRGEIVVEGRTYWLSAWIKDGKKGKFMSLALQPKEDRPTTREMPPAESSSRTPTASSTRRGSMKDDLEDEVPF